MRGNFIRQTGQGGIDLGPECFARALRGNVVLDAGGDGITTWFGHLEDNVVGRSQGVGVRVTGEPGYVARNTIFSSGGSGFALTGHAYPGDYVVNNIAAFNSGPGLLFVGEVGPHLGCNDWFKNQGGSVVGMAPGVSDLEVNPLFCDLVSADVHLAANSPLLAAPGCGLIGALGQGCAATSAVEGPTATLVTRFRVWPVPARGAIAFELPASAGVTALEVFDVAGARRWQTTIEAGATRLEWDRLDETGHRVAPGVYFARLRRAGLEPVTTRIVLAE
jgi:hypothetical protein